MDNIKQCSALKQDEKIPFTDKGHGENPDVLSRVARTKGLQSPERFSVLLLYISLCPWPARDSHSLPSTDLSAST